MNVAGLNKRLNEAASLIFTRRYGTRKKIVIRLELNERQSSSHSIKPNLQPIPINDLTLTLKFLRSFGHLLAEIAIHDRHPNETVLQYILTYCLEFSLVCPGLHVSRKPFVEVKISDPSRFREIDSYNVFYAKMHTLELSCAPDFIPEHFQFLRHLSIIDKKEESKWSMDEINSFKINLQKFFHFNPQIKHFIMFTNARSIMDENVIQCIRNKLPHLESLGLRIDDKFINSCNHNNKTIRKCPMKPITTSFPIQLRRFENLKKLELHMRSTIPIPFASRKLENLYLEYADDLNESHYDFFEKHPTIIIIVLKNVIHTNLIDYVKSVQHVKFSRMANALPSLEQLHFKSYIQIDELILSWNKFQSLNEISFHIQGELKNNDITLLQVNGWSISINQFLMDRSFIKLERSTKEVDTIKDIQCDSKELL